MARFDLPLEELRTYRPPVREPADFEAFWTETVGEARAVGAASSSIVEGHLRDVEIRNVRFPGFGGDPVAAWLLVPRGLDGPAPAVVQYLGYGGGRGLPYDNCLWACAGFVQLVMDTRVQGSSWGSGGARRRIRTGRGRQGWGS